MSSSLLIRRWIARALVVLLAAQIAALVSLATPASILGDAVGHAGDGTAQEQNADGGSEAPAPPPPGSETATSATGDSPPEVTPTITGTLGDNQWYTSDVALTWAVSDPETPEVTSDGCEDQNVVADTPGVTFTCTATSEGGTRATTVKIGRDATAPTDVTVTTDVQPSPSGWYTQPFVATWHGADATSGIASCTEAPPYSGPDTAAGSLDGTCTDNAGNETEPVPFAFKFDATAPDVAGTPDRPADHNGWYNHDLTITWSSGEAGATCDPPTAYTSGDDASATVTGTCTDEAGLSATGTFEFKFDETAPAITLTTPAEGAIYVLNQPVDADYACEDATSGIDSCSAPAADGADVDTAAVGSHVFEVTATDVAGNAATPVSHSYDVRYQPEGVDCGGVAGHTILEPIGKRSSFKQGSTVPAKFRVCDFFGAPVTAGGVVERFGMRAAGSDAEQDVPSTSSHDEFRAGSSQWIFNIDTKPMAQGEHLFRIDLNDGTSISFGFTLR